jgi:hypothetical protein
MSFPRKDIRGAEVAMAEDHVIQEGESVGSIAAQHGFFWKTLWNHGSNAALKDKRKNPEVLFPGDILHIPDIDPKKECKGTDAQHKFKKLGIPAKIVLKFSRSPKETREHGEPPKNEPWKFSESDPPVVQPEPLSNAAYELYADGKLVAKGYTDGDGKFAAPIPPAAGDGIVILNKGQPNEKTLELNFRQMDPIDQIPGLCKRLINLGFACPTDAPEVTPEIQEAIKAFQRRAGMEVNGKFDDTLKSKLKEVYGG